MRGRVLLLATALSASTALAGGCGLADSERGPDATQGPGGGEPPRTVETTRVQVIERAGRRGRFDPASIYRRLSPGVVTVISIFEGGKPALGDDDGQGGLGSGFVLDSEGYVATNAHVVTSGEGAPPKRAKEVYVEFADGNRVPARIVGEDPNADVALLKIDPAGLRLTPLRLGRSGRLTVGEPVAAIGSPFGEQQSLSVGVISAVDRDIQSLTQFGIGNAIQTDAAVNRGNSGGPLLDARGEVIGINSQIRSTSGGNEGVGFAVPVDTVRRSLDELRRTGRVAYAYLGVTTQPLYPRLARHLGLDVPTGALVVTVEEGGPADRAGLEPGEDKTDFQGQQDIPRGGDAIVSVDGRELRRAGDLSDIISAHRPGDRVELGVLRGDERRTVAVRLAPRPARANRRP